MADPAADPGVAAARGEVSHAPTLAGLRGGVEHNVATLDHELAEIELLVTQARAEAARHESKRSVASERLAAAAGASPADPAEILELNGQLVTVTKRAALMEAQVEVLEGKAKILRRYRDEVATLVDEITALERGSVVGAAPQPVGRSDGGEAIVPAGVSRIVLGAQEDLRREIARAMHDGPAQSLTNIVLQAQIVERLVSRDPEQARPELRQLIAMVQQTLDATKSFIFDVRPMVLDDLGLVPTLRRTARDRGRRAQIAVEFESLGLDRRLPMELESGLFRLLDEALASFLSANPDRVTIRLDWGDQVVAVVVAERSPTGAEEEQGESAAPARGTPGKPRSGKGGGKEGGRPGDRGSKEEEEEEEELPPALAAMIEDRRADSSAAAAEEARRSAWVPLPPAEWREIHDRAATLGIVAELLADGTEVRLVVDLPPVAAAD
jgi:two-component system sensor histidine kinase DegS